jgi:transposase
VVSAGLSHSQLTQLHEELKQQGIGHQGRSRSETDLTRAVHGVGVLQQQLNLSLNQSINIIAATELSTSHTIRSAYSSYSCFGTITPPSTKQDCSRSNPSHPFYTGESGPSLDAELIIHRLLNDVKLENTFESCNTLRMALAAEIGVVVSKSTIHRWLHALGYQYGKKNLINNQTSSYRHALIRSYIYKYAKALNEQETGKAILVYMDESYIFQHHCTQKLWFSLSSPTKNDVRGNDRGKRIIIMHAMTKDGLLEVEGVEPSNILTELYHSCALIFDEVCVDGITPADYHDTINGDKFIGWIQTRLLPTFRQKYPGKKMYLILDNAKYHHHRGPDWFSPSNKKKGQLADFLRQRSVSNITVDGGRVIPASKFSADARGTAGGATLEQLKIAVKQHLAAHPEINTTVPQQLLSDAGYELLYTPPYVSELQPIELIWAFTKAIVAHQSTRSRSVHEVAVQTRQAMDQVDAELCRKLIARMHRWIQQFMQSEEGGSLHRFIDLPLLMWASQQSFPMDDIAEPPPPVAEEDAEEQEEAQWTQ